MRQSLAVGLAVPFLLGLVLLTSTSYGNSRISCYTCDWNQVSGCKSAAKVTKDHLETNCTMCYKNVIPYKEGQAAAKGSRRCLQEADMRVAVGYTGKPECRVVNGSLHCYCRETKCNHGETSYKNNLLLILTSFLVVTMAMT